MATSLSSQPTSRILRAVVVGAFLSVAASAPVFAAHHARLSADLADHLAVGSQSIDVIVHGDRATVDRLAARYNVTVKRYLRSGAVLEVTAGQLAALQDDQECDHLSGDIKIKTSADPMAEGIGADQVWAGVGDLPPLSGRGVTVALIDSGIDPTHNALKRRVLRTVDFTGGDGVDRFGHGTHVAALIAGQHGRTPDTNDFQGIASGAYLVNLRVLGNDGSGSSSDVIEAIDWAIEHRLDYNIRVINLSLGAPVLQTYRDDPLCEAVERAVRAGIVVVAAAGNYGQTADGKRILGGITSPGNSPYALTVGALDTKGTAVRSDDEVASFSSGGPTRFDLVLKPDLVAPGRRVVSAEATGSLLATLFPERHVAGTGANAYIQGSGTSMAAGVVSGAVALVLEARPELKPAAAKAALQMTSSFMPSAGLVRAGAGSLNVLAAIHIAKDGNAGPTVIGGESIVSSRLVVLPVESRRVTAQGHAGTVKIPGSLESVVWGSSRSLVWGASLIWGASGSVVWGSSSSLIWGATDSLIWGATNSVVWGSADSVVWGSSDSVVWGSSGSVVWGSSDSVIWGSSDSVVWGSSNSLVWGATNSVVWGASDSVVWGS